MISTRRSLFLILTAVALVHPFAAGQGGKPVTRPNFEGIWNSATATPLERPPQLKDKAVLHAGGSRGVGTPGRAAQ